MTPRPLSELLAERLEPVFKTSKSEQRLRDGMPDAQTLPARAIGYSWGIRDESERLSPLHAQLLKCVEALELAQPYVDNNASGFEGMAKIVAVGSALKESP